VQRCEDKFDGGRRGRGAETDKSAGEAHYGTGRAHDMKHFCVCRGQRLRQRHGGGETIGQRVREVERRAIIEGGFGAQRHRM
jgi:hypothetical protein